MANQPKNMYQIRQAHKAGIKVENNVNGSKRTILGEYPLKGHPETNSVALRSSVTIPNSNTKVIVDVIVIKGNVTHVQY